MPSAGSKIATNFASKAPELSNSFVHGSEIITPSANFTRAAQNAHEKVRNSSDSKVASAANKISNVAMFGPAIGGFVAKAGKWKWLENNAVGKFLRGIGDVTQIFNKEVREVPAAVRHLFGEKVTETGVAIVKPAVSKGFGAKIASEVGQLGFGDALAGGATFFEMFSLYKDRKNTRDTLKSMQGDLTGKPDMHHLDPLVAKINKAERTGSKPHWSTALKASGIIASGAIWLRSSKIKNAMLWSIAAGMVPNLIASTALSGHTATAGYMAMAKSFKRYGQAPVEDYVALLGGIEPRANAQAIQALAQDLCEKKLKPGQVMQYVKKIDLLHLKVPEETLLQASAAGAANKPAVVGKHTAAATGQKTTKAGEHQVIGQHTAVAMGQKTPGKLVAMDKDQQVVGKHTATTVAMDKDSSLSQAI